MGVTGVVEMRQVRLTTLIERLSHELLLATPYPDVQARLTAQRIRAQIELEELARPIWGRDAD